MLFHDEVKLNLALSYDVSHIHVPEQDESCLISSSSLLYCWLDSLISSESQNDALYGKNEKCLMEKFDD